MGALIGIITTVLSGPGSNGNEWGTPQSPKLQNLTSEEV